MKKHVVFIVILVFITLLIIKGAVILHGGNSFLAN